MALYLQDPSMNLITRCVLHGPLVAGLGLVLCVPHGPLVAGLGLGDCWFTSALPPGHLLQ